MFSQEHYTAAREGAAVLDRATRGRVLLTGSDRLTYLQGLLTNDIAGLAPGTGCYAALLTPQGRMISDMRVFELGDSALLDVPGALAPRVAAHLTDFVFSEDVVVQDVSGTQSHLTLLGSASADALVRRSSSAENASVCSAAELRRLRAYENRRCRIGAAAAVVASNDDFGVPALDLFVDTALKPAILSALTDAGVTAIDDDIADVLRIEAGTPQFGADMDKDTIPLEAGIENRAISATKGCYVGQEVIIRVLHRGHGRVARRLVGLVFSAEGQVPARGERLHAGGRQVGTITSPTWSPALGRPIALGYLHRDFTSPGTAVESGDERQTATVASLPFRYGDRDSRSMSS